MIVYSSRHDVFLLEKQSQMAFIESKAAHLVVENNKRLK